MRLSIMATDTEYLVNHYPSRELFRSLGGKWDGQYWRLTRTPSVAQALYQLTQQLGETPPPELKEDMESAPVDIEFSSDLWEHQVQALKFALPLRSAMLAMDMGTGKTRVALEIIKHRGHKRVLVLCPKAVAGVWEYQAGLYSTLNYYTLVDSNGKHSAVLERITEPALLTVNYDLLANVELVNRLAQHRFSFLIMDESHRLKSPSGVWSKAAQKLGKAIPYKLALTGTPMPHSPLDVYGQFRALDPGIVGGSYSAFKERYAVVNHFRAVVGYRNLDELANRMKAVTYRVTNNVLSLPKLLEAEHPVTLPQAAREAYALAQEGIIYDLERGAITAQNALVKTLRLRQITAGHADVDGTTLAFHDAKIDAIKDILDGISDERVVIFCEFRAEIEALAKAITQPAYILSGQRKDDLAEWRTTPGSVLLVQSQVGSLGIDLTAARYAIFASLPWSLGVYEQAKARVHRAGQTRPVEIIHILAKDTIDVTVSRALKTRQDVVQAVLSNLRTVS